MLKRYDSLAIASYATTKCGGATTRLASSTMDFTLPISPLTAPSKHFVHHSNIRLALDSSPRECFVQHPRASTRRDHLSLAGRPYNILPDRPCITNVTLYYICKPRRKYLWLRNINQNKLSRILTSARGNRTQSCQATIWKTK